MTDETLAGCLLWAKIVDQSTSVVTCTRIKFIASYSFTVRIRIRYTSIPLFVVYFSCIFGSCHSPEARESEYVAYAYDFASLLKWKTSFENTSIITLLNVDGFDNTRAAVHIVHILENESNAVV